MLPLYIQLLHSGELDRRIQAGLALQSPCRLCPRGCGARRAQGETGFCGAPVAPKVFRYAPHFGEEPPISGTRGSGTVFFSGCGLRCVYCQNHTFSQEGAGTEVSCDKLARMFLELKAQGCHNVNCVTPTHFLPQLLTALKIAAGEGFDLPIVYNTSGYESLGALALVDGCVDIYLADMRYSSGESAARCSGARDYPAVNRAAVKEMWRQGGAVAIDKAGVARRGLIVRHLVLPGRLAGTRESFRFLAGEVSRTVSVSLMNQYTPCHAAIADPLLGRRITREEYDEATACLDECGLEFGWVQEWSEDADDECFLGTSLTANV